MRTADAVNALSGVPETLLIPLAARATAPQRYPGFRFNDPLATQLARTLGIDQTRYAGSASTAKGCIARAQWFDAICTRVIVEHTNPLIVSLGSGLNTMYERVRARAGSRNFQWVDSDLPAVAAIRRRILPDDDRRRTIDADAAQTDWIDDLNAGPGQTMLIVAEGLLMYLPPEACARLFREIAERLGTGRRLFFAFDWSSPLMVRNSRRHPGISKIKDQAVTFAWSLREAGDIAAYHPGWRIIAESSAPMTRAGFGPVLFAGLHRLFTGRRFYACALARLEREARPG